MTQRKKMTIAIIVLVAMFVISTASLVVALVVGSQRATSSVNVKYVSNDVSVKVEANYYVGGVATAMVTSDNKTFIELKPKQETGSLNQPSNVSVVNLSAENDRIIYEYIFTNMSTEISATINQTVVDGTVVIPTDKSGKDNAKLTYKASSTQLGASVTSDNETFSPRALTAGGKEYVYVIVSVKDLLHSMQFNGDFGWTLNRGIEATTETTTGSGSSQKIINIVEEKSNCYNSSELDNIKLVLNCENEEPAIYPQVSGKMFEGWHTSPTPTDANKIKWPAVITEDMTLYANNITATNSGMTFDYNSTTQSYTVTDSAFNHVNLIIPDVYTGTEGQHPVTKISTFELSHSSLRLVRIPKTIVEIGDRAFSGSIYLTNLEIPDGCTKIGARAFEGCSDITTISFGKGLKNIGDYAFSNCTSLTEVDLPSISSFGYNPFAGCSNLETLRMIKNDMYSSQDDKGIQINGIMDDFAHLIISATKNIKLTSKLDLRGFYVSSFQGINAITALDFTKYSIQYIAESTFSRCVNLKSVKINSVSRIESSAFSGCSSLTSFTIPEACSTIGKNAFNGCTALTSVTFENQTGWQAGTTGIVDLSNQTNNATFLKTTYVSQTWTRS